MAKPDITLTDQQVALLVRIAHGLLNGELATHHEPVVDSIINLENMHKVVIYSFNRGADFDADTRVLTNYGKELLCKHILQKEEWSGSQTSDAPDADEPVGAG